MANQRTVMLWSGKSIRFQNGGNIREARMWMNWQDARRFCVAQDITFWDVTNTKDEQLAQAGGFARQRDLNKRSTNQALAHH